MTSSLIILRVVSQSHDMLTTHIVEIQMSSCESYASVITRQSVLLYNLPTPSDKIIIMPTREVQCIKQSERWPQQSEQWNSNNSSTHIANLYLSESSLVLLSLGLASLPWPRVALLSTNYLTE